MVRTKLNSKAVKIVFSPPTPAHSPVVSTATGKKLPHKRPQAALTCRSPRSHPAERSLPRHAPARAHSRRGRQPAGKRPEASAPTRLRDGGGRWAETSLSRPRKPNPRRKRAIGNPGLRTEQPRVRGRGPGRLGGPPLALRPLQKPLAPRPHPSHPAAPGVPLAPSRYAGRSRPEASARCGWAGPAATSERSRSRAPVPALSSARPCSAGDGPPSCMLTLRRHFRKWLRPGGSRASSPSAEGRRRGESQAAGASLRRGVWPRPVARCGGRRTGKLSRECDAGESSFPSRGSSPVRPREPPPRLALSPAPSPEAQAGFGEAPKEPVMPDLGGLHRNPPPRSP